MTMRGGGLGDAALGWFGDRWSCGCLFGKWDGAHHNGDQHPADDFLFATDGSFIHSCDHNGHSFHKYYDRRTGSN